MSVTLRFPNFEVANIKERTNLAVETTAGDATLILFNSQGIAANDSALVGNIGGESSELLSVISALTPSSITVDATKHNHAYNSEVIILNAPQLKVYRALNVNGSVPADGDFSLITTIGIDPDQIETNYIDPVGSSVYWYKATYYNATSSFESTLADAVGIRGDDGGLYVTAQEVKEEAGFGSNQNIPYTRVLEKLQAAQSYIDGKLSNAYTVPFTAPINPHIKELTRVLAAGYLQLREFGTYGTADTANGNEKTKYVEDQLKLLISGQVKLVNTDGSTPGQPAKSETSDLGMSGWPNNTTADVAPGTPGAGDHMFKVSDVAGYGERAY